uniref:ATP synthase complex subunit 8 n=1 Tax=Dopasia harti TaxID=102193 RepID=U3M8C3_9SAUR|nr:ATP synthase F0 subunit 8 [Dopasia harti]AGV03078.1 ATP synthase F0 subunit 8 [Dopasia harti]AHG30989.1 ATP synthase F0 subunit 8 [Dopasia harti]
MPQLNPSPWLLILALSWLTLTALFLYKTQNACFYSTPTHHQTNKQKTNTWIWPWP